MRRKTKIEGTLPLHELLLGNINFELVVHVLRKDKRNL